MTRGAVGGKSFFQRGGRFCGQTERFRRELYFTGKTFENIVTAHEYQHIFGIPGKAGKRTVEVRGDPTAGGKKKQTKTTLKKEKKGTKGVCKVPPILIAKTWKTLNQKKVPPIEKVSAGGVRKLKRRGNP